MKKIIAGKQYDTEKAVNVANWTPITDKSDYTDPYRVSEILYRKKTGEYFLYCQGGPLSRYADMDPKTHEWLWGERIRPLDYDEARMWAEENFDPEDYEPEFGTANDDNEDETVVLSISLPASIAAKGRKRARVTGARSLSAYIAALIEND